MPLTSTPPMFLEFVSLVLCHKCSFQICQSHKSCEIDPVKLKDGENLENNMVRGSGLPTSAFQSQSPLLNIFGTWPRWMFCVTKIQVGVGTQLRHALRGRPLEAEVERLTVSAVSSDQSWLIICHPLSLLLASFLLTSCHSVACHTQLLLLPPP